MEEAAVVPGDRENLWTRVRSNPGAVVAIGVVSANFFLGLLTNQLLFRDFPNSGDEYSYQISARLFAEGKLSVPSPEPRGFFDFYHILNQGRFYGKYPPGWPALLAVGMVLGAPPWIVNQILSAAALAACFAVARRHFSPEVAIFAMLLALANPFLVINSASYFSHTACLLFVTVFLGAALDWLRDPASRKAALTMGACGGASFLTRPYTAFVLMGLAGSYIAYRSWKTGTLKSLGACLLWAAVPGLSFLSLHLLYNHYQTGSALLSPFALYNAADKPSLSVLGDLPERLQSHGLGRIIHLAKWLPLSPLFALLYVLIPGTRTRFPGGLLAGFPVCLLAAHFFYRGTGTNQYGPRYLFEGTTALILLTACVLQSLPRGRIILLGSVLFLNALGLVHYGRYYADQIRDRMTLYDQVERQGLRHAIVFLRTGTGDMEPRDLTRNGIHFDGPVLYVLDRGPLNEELLKRYPDRQAFYFEYNPTTRTGRLLPWSSHG